MPGMVQAFCLKRNCTGWLTLSSPLASVCSAPPAPSMPRRVAQQQSNGLRAQQRLGGGPLAFPGWKRVIRLALRGLETAGIQP